MAVVVVLAGGMIGFFAGLGALLLGTGILAAIGLWLGVSAATSLLAGLFALLPRRNLRAAEV